MLVRAWSTRQRRCSLAPTRSGCGSSLGRRRDGKPIDAALAVQRVWRGEVWQHDTGAAGGCQAIWRELMNSRLYPTSTAEVDAAELRQLASGVEEMRRLLAMFPN